MIFSILTVDSSIVILNVHNIVLSSFWSRHVNTLWDFGSVLQILALNICIFILDAQKSSNKSVVFKAIILGVSCRFWRYTSVSSFWMLKRELYHRFIRLHFGGIEVIILKRQPEIKGTLHGTSFLRNLIFENFHQTSFWGSPRDTA